MESHVTKGTQAPFLGLINGDPTGVYSLKRVCPASYCQALKMPHCFRQNIYVLCLFPMLQNFYIKKNCI